PPEYGGLGGDTISYALAIEELAWADASLALTYAAHCSLGAGYLHLFGSPEQKARWLTPAARGEALIAFALTEPGGGSDAAHPQTRAERRDEGWLLNGSKVFITNGAHAAATVIMAATRPGAARGASPPFWCRRARLVSPSGPSMRSWGCGARTRRPWPWRTCWWVPRRWWGKRAGGTSKPWRCWTGGGSASPRWQWGSGRRLWTG